MPRVSPSPSPAGRRWASGAERLGAQVGAAGAPGSCGAAGRGAADGDQVWPPCPASGSEAGAARAAAVCCEETEAQQPGFGREAQGERLGAEGAPLRPEGEGGACK